MTYKILFYIVLSVLVIICFDIGKTTGGMFSRTEALEDYIAIQEPKLDSWISDVDFRIEVLRTMVNQGNPER